MQNYFKIVGAFIIFYTFNIFHFWGVFELGINSREAGTMYHVIIFVMTIVVGMFMLISGRISNETKNKYDFLREEQDRLLQFKAEEDKIKKRAAVAAENEKAAALAINDDPKEATNGADTGARVEVEADELADN
jgi:hypothetical protein